MQNSCYANKSDPHHLSLNQIEQKFSVVNKSEKIRPSHLVRREGGGFRKAIVLPHYLYVSPLVVPKPSFFFDPSSFKQGLPLMMLHSITLGLRPPFRLLENNRNLNVTSLHVVRNEWVDVYEVSTLFAFAEVDTGGHTTDDP